MDLHTFQELRPVPTTLGELVRATVRDVVADFEDQGVTADMIYADDRRRPVAQARHIIMRRLFDADISASEIGRRIGGRGHSVVLYSLGRLKKKPRDMRVIP